MTTYSDQLRKSTVEPSNNKMNPEAVIEGIIIEKVNQQIKCMIGNLTKSIKMMIKEEIKTMELQLQDPPRAPSDAETNTTESRDRVITTQTEGHPGARIEETDPDVNQESEWTNVGRGRRNRQVREQENKAGKEATGRIMGTRQGGNRIKAAEKSAWLYVGKLDQDTTEEDIRDYLKENGVTGKINCDLVNERPGSRAFKIGIPLQDLELVHDGNFWPKDVICRPFRQPWRYRGPAPRD